MDADLLGYHFYDRDLVPITVQMGGDLPKHTGIVEFQTKDMLRTAMGMSGMPLEGRPMRIELFDPDNIWPERKDRDDRPPR